MKQKGKRQLLMRNDGLYKLSYTLHPSVFPFFNGMTMCPQDVMHAEFSSGIANSEFAALLYVLIRDREISVEQFNAALKQYDFPRGHRPPAVHASVASGTQDRNPKSDCHVRWSGSQMLHFAQHSVALLGPMLSREALRSKVWQAWILHVRYLEILLRPAFTRQDVLDLDHAIRAHQKLFGEITEYTA